MSDERRPDWVSVTVSPDFRITIPEEYREKMRVQPGDKVMWMVKHGTVRLVRVPTLDEMQGFAKGMNVEGYREEEDEI